MALLVRYKNDGIGYITKYDLNNLIVTGKIEAFMRGDGHWVNPERDPIRRLDSMHTYTGPERRGRY